MPDTKGFQSFFDDYAAPKQSFRVVDTLGTDPTGDAFPIVSAQSTVVTAVPHILAPPPAFPTRSMDHGTPEENLPAVPFASRGTVNGS